MKIKITLQNQNLQYLTVDTSTKGGKQKNEK